MRQSKYKKARASFNPDTKELFIEQPITDFVPSYVYYVCEDLERQKGITIKTVAFAAGASRTYTKEELRGKYDWSDIDESK